MSLLANQSLDSILQTCHVKLPDLALCREAKQNLRGANLPKPSCRSPFSAAVLFHMSERMPTTNERQASLLHLRASYRHCRIISDRLSPGSKKYSSLLNATTAAESRRTKQENSILPTPTVERPNAGSCLLQRSPRSQEADSGVKTARASLNETLSGTMCLNYRLKKLSSLPAQRCNAAPEPSGP